MTQILISGCISLIFINLLPCVSRNQYERLQSSKDRLSKSLVYTEKELTSLRATTYEIIDKFEKGLLIATINDEKIKNLAKQ